MFLPKLKEQNVQNVSLELIFLSCRMVVKEVSAGNNHVVVT